MTGAALLCATAALRSGAGLVTLGVPTGLQAAVAASAPWEVMTLPLPETRAGTFRSAAVSRVRDYIRDRKVTSLAIGPGLSVTHDTVALVRSLLRAVKEPMVLDADALNALARAGGLGGSRAPLVLTPHPGEAARLLGTSTDWVQARRSEACTRLARRTRAVCVLKGHRTLVSDGRRIFVNPTGNPGMASGGTGDVLSGLTAGLLAQVRAPDPQEQRLAAALIGVYVHGLAGDLAARRSTRLALTAGDVLAFLPEAFRRTFGRHI
jgi:ADP-dependent NAD(P)H-hydrate dehydratase / NAD(P)H-hydrate epimerase